MSATTKAPPLPRRKKITRAKIHGKTSIGNDPTTAACADRLADGNSLPAGWRLVLLPDIGDGNKLGRGWVWSGELNQCIQQNHVFRTRVYASTSNTKFISSHASTFDQNFFFDDGKHTTDLVSISMTKLKAPPTSIPPSSEQARIISEVERRLSLKDPLKLIASTNFIRAKPLSHSLLHRSFNPTA